MRDINAGTCSMYVYDFSRESTLEKVRVVVRVLF